MEFAFEHRHLVWGSARLAWRVGNRADRLAQRVRPVAGKCPPAPQPGRPCYYKQRANFYALTGDRNRARTPCRMEFRLKNTAGRPIIARNSFRKPAVLNIPLKRSHSATRTRSYSAQFRLAVGRVLPHGAMGRLAGFGSRREGCTIFLSKSAKALGGTCKMSRCPADFPGSVGLCAAVACLPVAAAHNAENSTRGFD